MKKTTKILLIIGLVLSLVGLATAQTNTTTFFNSFTGYFTAFNTNYDASVFGARGDMWTSVDSIQGGPVSLADGIGISYNILQPTNAPTRLSLENVIRNSGVAGTLVSEQFGLGGTVIVHDTRVTVYADGGYQFNVRRGPFYGEIGLRIKKNLTQNTFGGVGLGAQLPANRQVFQVLAGFTF